MVKEYQVRLYRLCMAYLGDPHEAEEAAHVSFIKAYGGLERFRKGSSFGTWLFRIGVNHCKDALRKRRRNRLLSLEELSKTDGKVPEALRASPAVGGPPGSPSIDPTALKHLSRGERAVLMRVAENPGVDYGEIGRALGLSREGVKGRLKRARLKVLTFLKKRRP